MLLFLNSTEKLTSASVRSSARQSLDFSLPFYRLTLAAGVAFYSPPFPLSGACICLICTFVPTRSMYLEHTNVFTLKVSRTDE